MRELGTVMVMIHLMHRDYPTSQQRKRAAPPSVNALVYAPTALMWAPGFTSLPSNRGVDELVHVQMTSASRTTAALRARSSSATPENSTPSGDGKQGRYTLRA